MLGTLFFNTKIIRSIAEWTNIYIEKISVKYIKDSDAKKTNKLDMRALSQLLYLCGLHKPSNANAPHLWALVDQALKIYGTQFHKKGLFFYSGACFENVTDREARKKK